MSLDDTFSRLPTSLAEAAHLEQVDAQFNYYPDHEYLSRRKHKLMGLLFLHRPEDHSLAADAANAAGSPPAESSKEASSALTSLLGAAYKLKHPAARVRSAAEEAKDEAKR